MKELTINQMELLEAGDFVTGFCIGVGSGSVIYTAGALTNFWNPVGWVSGAFLLADAACLAYAAYNAN